MLHYLNPVFGGNLSLNGIHSNAKFRLATLLVFIFLGYPLYALQSGDVLENPVSSVRYQIIEKRGQGTEGTVYSATILSGPRRNVKIAIKIPHKQNLSIHEIPTSKSLGLEGVNSKVQAVFTPEFVQLLDKFGEAETLLMIPMELAGTTLDETALSIYSSEKKATQLLGELEAGLGFLEQYAKRQLVHGDIKPKNILVSWDENQARTQKLADIEGSKKIGKRGVPFTPLYASPERLSYQAKDLGGLPTEDAFSFAIVMGERLLGRRLLEDFVAKRTNSTGRASVIHLFLYAEKLLSDPVERSLWNSYVRESLDEADIQFATASGLKKIQKIKQFMTPALEAHPIERWKELNRQLRGTPLLKAYGNNKVGGFNYTMGKIQTEAHFWKVFAHQRKISHPVSMQVPNCVTTIRRIMTDLLSHLKHD